MLCLGYRSRKEVGVRGPVMAEPLVTAELILKKMTDFGLVHLPSGTLWVWFAMVWCGSPTSPVGQSG